jgi:hypothetical protein
MLGSQVAMADCDFSTGVQSSGTGYLYTKECHKKVGKLVEDADKREKQVEHLEKALDLKDLALNKADERNGLLRESLYKVEDRVNTMEKLQESNKVLYFIGGVLFTGLAVWSAGQLRK